MLILICYIGKCHKFCFQLPTYKQLQLLNPYGLWPLIMWIGNYGNPCLLVTCWRPSSVDDITTDGVFRCLALQPGSLGSFPCLTLTKSALSSFSNKNTFSFTNTSLLSWLVKLILFITECILYYSLKAYTSTILVFVELSWLVLGQLPNADTSLLDKK